MKSSNGASLLPKDKKSAKAAKKQQASSATVPQTPPAAAAPPNPRMWPETEPLAIDVCERLREYLGALQCGVTDEQLAGAREKLEQYMFHTEVTATVKLDGTNVGKESGGGLVGRRLRISSTETSYCRTPLTPLGDVDARAVEVALISELSPSTAASLQPGQCTVYGELLCKDLYHFRAAKRRAFTRMPPTLHF